jgi:ADP-ribose diphosphatase
MSAQRKPEILERRIVARSRMFSIEQLELRFANGVERTYERLHGSSRGAVLVVPMPDPDSMVLIREYSAGTDRYELAFPKGRIETDETPLQAGGRELQEEIGFAARRLELLRSVTLAPGFLGASTHILLARDLYPAPLEGDEPEPIETLTWPLTEVAALLAREDFTEGRSLLAVYLLLEFLGRKADVA